MTSYCLQEQAEFFTTVLQSPFLSIQLIVITIFKIPLKYKQYGPSHKKNTYTQFIVDSYLSFLGTKPILLYHLYTQTQSFLDLNGLGAGVAVTLNSFHARRVSEYLLCCHSKTDPWMSLILGVCLSITMGKYYTETIAGRFQK